MAEAAAHVTMMEQRKMLEHALGTNGQDNERFLDAIRERMDRVGLRFPSVELRFENLTAQAKVYLGNRSLPSLPNFARNVITEALCSLRLVADDRTSFPVLNGCSSVLKPGRMTLLLGPPGAGKSTLLKALCGHTDHSGITVSGDISYNGHAMTEFLAERTAAYVPQNDSHFAELTVRDTLDFSAAMHGPAFPPDLLAELRRREAEQGITEVDAAVDAVMQAMSESSTTGNIVTDYFIQLLGLSHCAGSPVGNELKRGLSGGEKKRLTVGEGVMGFRRVFLLDEISTGLDSSTTLLITRCLQNICHSLDAVMMISLLQPAPETYDLFDDVMLLSEGFIVFHGPREEVLPFFEAQGFKCPERKGVADFLQEVLSLKDQSQYWHHPMQHHTYVPAVQLHEEYKASTSGQAMKVALASPCPKDPSALCTQRYALSIWQTLMVVMHREWLWRKRNKLLHIAILLQLLLAALAVSTMFLFSTWSITLLDSMLITGALFFENLALGLLCLTEVLVVIERWQVVYKHRRALLYPSWTWLVSMVLMSMLISVFTALLWTTITYFLIGFSQEASRFFIQALIIFLYQQAVFSYFRMAACIARYIVLALSFGSFMLAICFLLGGFVLTKQYIKPWWIWGYWISPLSYSQNAISINEFLAPRWQVPISPGSPVTLGHYVLSAHDYFTDQSFIWVSVGGLIVLIAASNIIAAIALTYLHPMDAGNPMSAAQLAARKAAREGGAEAVAAALPSRVDRSVRLKSFRLSADREGEGVVKSGRMSIWNSRREEDAGADKAVGGSLSLESRADKDEEDAEMGTATAVSTSLNQHGMVLPFIPLSLSFHNISYWVDMPAAMKQEGAAPDARLQLLCSVSGAFRPGVLTALMGVSGAGKTTLMDVLAGRKTGGHIEGEIRVGGYPKEDKTFARIVGYCEQTDIHTPQLTVLESLVFSARLRLSGDNPLDVVMAFVHEIMDLVELTDLSTALVGLPGVNGLSTEQRKRLTIAVELVANPSIIFMDEPTSGLDARAAAVVMRTVRNTVDTGRTVVCTIHQPSIDIFEAFDELLMLQRGGRVVYSGVLGVSSQAMTAYFQSIPGIPPLPDGVNPATWMLEISSPDVTETLDKSLPEYFLESQAFQATHSTVTSLSQPPKGSSDLSFASDHATSPLTQYLMCLWKFNCVYWRSPEYNLVRFIFSLVIGLLIGGIFFGLGKLYTTAQEVLNLMGALYASALFIGWNSASTVQPIIAVERSVFYRERAAGLYAGSLYALAQGTMELPYAAVQTLLYCLITYSMIQFQWTAAKFCWFFIFMLLSFLYFTFYGMMAIGITPDKKTSVVLSSFLFSLWNLNCGFLIPQPSIPVWWRWFSWIDPIFWTLYGLVASQLGDQQSAINIFGVQTSTVSLFLSSYFGYHTYMLGYIVLILAGFSCVFFAIFIWALQKINFNKR